MVLLQYLKKDYFMKQTLLLTLSSFVIATLMTACSSKIPFVDTDTTDNSEECIDIDKKLIKVDNFIVVVNNTSAFHLEEAATAIPAPGITVSNNKEKMLRDANRKKAELSKEHQKLGCETTKK